MPFVRPEPGRPAVSALPSSLGSELRVVNPATLAEVGLVRVTEPEGIGEIVAEARLAQERWARQPFAARTALLREAARVLLESLDEIAATIVAETGKPLLEAITSEGFVSLDTAVWLARHAEHALRDERVPFRSRISCTSAAGSRTSRSASSPIVSPWNFPFSIPFTQAATAVAAGNAAVVKPAELTPLSGAWVEEIFRRAGAPAGLVRVVQGAGDVVGDALVRARGVSRIVFTGSGEVGRTVAVRAAERLCPVTLELGGKDPMLVLADADLDRAVEGALWGSFSNCGQICSGVERIYVEGDLFEPFVSRLGERARPSDDRRRRATRVSRSARSSPASSGRASRRSSPTRSRPARSSQPAAGGPTSRCPDGSTSRRSCSASPPARASATEEIFGPVVTVVKIAERRGRHPTGRTGRRTRWAPASGRATGRRPGAVAARLEAGLGLDERRRILVRCLPGALGRAQGVRLRANALAPGAQGARRTRSSPTPIRAGSPHRGGSRTTSASAGRLSRRAGALYGRGPRLSDEASGGTRRARRRSAGAPWKGRAPMSELSHVDETGGIRMVDVGAKPLIAAAGGCARDRRDGGRDGARLRELPKGDALVTAQLAGIMAAKRTHELIPLCHPLAALLRRRPARPSAMPSSRSRRRRRRPRRRASRWRRCWPCPSPP